jgi:hypothetical protein
MFIIYLIKSITTSISVRKVNIIQSIDYKIEMSKDI